jgi:alpha-galactosidase
VTAHPIELNSGTLNIGVDVDEDGRVAVTTIAGGGVSFRAGHRAPAVELQCVDAPHAIPLAGLTGSAGGARLGYREHATGVDGGTHWLAVTTEQADCVGVRWLLRTRPGSAALTSTVEVTNIGTEDLLVGALPSLSVAVTGEAAGAAFGPDDLDLIAGVSEWCGENRWQRRPVRDEVPALSSAPHPLAAKGAHGGRALGSWSQLARCPPGPSRPGMTALPSPGRWSTTERGGGTWSREPAD